MTRGLPGIPLNLALQGGGAHGAFTWGVLDRLLEEPELNIAGISATSAGAVNAVALTAGMIDGGRSGARARLDAVWQAVLDAQLPEFVRGFARASMSQIVQHFSPYEFNPLGFDPLRTLLNQYIEFDRLRTQAPFELLIATTEANTGRARLFRRHELTVETVLASACLPMLNHAVVIDGIAYWDGGFSANPDLVTLAGAGLAGDTVVVLLNELSDDRANAPPAPMRPRDIAAHVNALTFHQPLARDLALIGQIRRMGWLGLLRAPPSWRNLRRHRFHVISSLAHTQPLPPSTKAEPDARVFALLKEAGRNEAEVWLAAHTGDLGRRSSAFGSPLSNC